MLQFEWDERKAATNLKKHGISFKEAATVFGDFLSAMLNDPDHSVGEHSFLTIGVSTRGRVLIVAHTAHGDTVRIISAREITRQERRIYEEES